AASIAAAGEKWMSATRGTGIPLAFRSRLISPMALASLTVGAGMRTISQPASTRRMVCARVPSMSSVRVVVIDCTRIRWSPATVTLPIATSRYVRRAQAKREAQYVGDANTMMAELSAVRRSMRAPVDRRQRRRQVIDRDDDHQCQQDDDTHEVVGGFSLGRYAAAADPLQHHEKQAA